MAEAPNFSSIETPPGKANEQQWMPMPNAPGGPSAFVGCPPGLEYLAQIDQLLVHQVVEVAEVLFGCERKNKYAIKNALGQQVYYAMEDTSFCNRCWCGAERGFTMHITDNSGNEVMRIVRPFQCCSGCSWCATPGTHCAYLIQMESPPGQIIGYASQTRTWLYSNFVIMDAERNPVLQIKGPCCGCQAVCCRCDIPFNILTNDKSQQLGVIGKQWSGWLKECCTGADNFGITFPKDLDVKVKATLVAAMFLIDFMYFEGSN